MNEPWISQKMLGVLIMSLFIPLGPLVGTLGWLFVPKGKARKLTLGVITIGFVMGFVLLVFGIFAYFFGQPRWVWLRSGFYGLDCTVLFAIVYWIILKKYKDTEFRKLTSEDLSLTSNGQRHNEEEKEISYE